MDKRLADLVTYRGDRLFEGAIDTSWLIQNRDKAREAAAAYVFHGPAYHGVSQQDIGTTHGHSLIDTASFAYETIRSCTSHSDRPFTLAIAGYGTGKSHLATALSVLLAEPESKSAEKVLANLEAADRGLHAAVRRELDALDAPALVVSLNGMGNFDLTAEFTRQVVHYLSEAGLDTAALDELRPRFKYAAELVDRLHDDEGAALASQCGLENVSEVLDRLHEHDESTYAVTHDYLAILGFNIRAFGDETVKEVIEVVCREYVGSGHPFSHLAVLFDEFGRYAEFATVRSQIAGSGVLQQLFEGIQSNSDKTTFVGFIQFDLNTYVQRMGQEYRNEILRVSTRYQSAAKAYLSINLETLIANLLEKNNPAGLDAYFDTETERAKSLAQLQRLNSLLPQTQNHRLWTDVSDFHRIVRKGCWPLSPYATWLMFHLAAAGQHLQQRSALSLLGETLAAHADDAVTGFDERLSAADMWTDSLQQELLGTEEQGNLGAVTHAYTSVVARVGHSLGHDEIQALRTIVLSSKLGLTVSGRDEAIEALAEMSDVTAREMTVVIDKLENDSNVVAWDERFNQFEIVGDTVSRPQFLAFLRQRVADDFSGADKKAQLFARHGSTFAPEILCDRVGDFAEENGITTSEWIFTSSITNLTELPRTLAAATARWQGAIAVDQPRGSIVYCYVEPDTDLARVESETGSLLKGLARDQGVKAMPILVVFLHDIEGTVGQCIAELTVLSEQLTEQDRARFGGLVAAHRKKCQELLASQLEELIRQRSYKASVSGDIGAGRLAAVCDHVFEAIYPRVLPFPFDGFATSRGNAADTCHSLTFELIRGQLTYNNMMAKPAKEKNRGNSVLKSCWGMFTKNGDISQRPQHEAVRAVYSAWEGALKDNGGTLPLADLLWIACRPPYGANVASAGLLLASFLAARQELFAVRKENVEHRLSELTIDMLFRGKFLDLARLRELILFIMEGPVDPWREFLDEWEAALEATYVEQIEFLDKALSMQRENPIPKRHTYRYELLKDKAEQARDKLDDFHERADVAYARIEAAEQKEDIHNLSFGADKLRKLVQDMEADGHCTQAEIDRYQAEVQRVCQKIIQVFQPWLARQAPYGRNVAAATQFDRVMHQTKGNLEHLGLFNEAEAAYQHALKAIREINALAEAQELVERVNGWLAENESLLNTGVAGIRNRKTTSADYLKSVGVAAKKVSVPELEDARTRLQSFISECKAAEKRYVDRASGLWDRRVTPQVIEEMLSEARDLEVAFEGCDSDVKDFRLMRRVLDRYRDAYSKMCDENLTAERFASLEHELLAKLQSEFASDEPPWMPDEVIPILHREAAALRESQGIEWLAGMSEEVSRLHDLEIEEARNLFSRLEREPAYLSEQQRQQARALETNVRDLLNSMKVDWLVGEYRELDNGSQTRFLQEIGVK